MVIIVSGLYVKYKLKLKTIVAKILLLILTVFIVFLFSLSVGSVTISLKEVFLSLLSKIGIIEYNVGVLEKIIFGLRFSRTLAAILVGASLAISGVLIQASTRNPLAEPFLLGLSSGALMFVCLFIIIIPETYVSSTLMITISFIGALTALFITMLISEFLGGTPLSLILAGIAVSAMFAGVSQLLAFIVQFKLNIPFLILLLGSFSNIVSVHVTIISISFAIGFIIAVLISKRLNALIFGDEHAFQLGYNPKILRYISVIVTSFLTGAAVAVSGIIGFIGLVIPHISRLIVGNDHRVLIPSSALIGGSILCFSDTIVRYLSVQLGLGELPVGALMNIIGAPFFIYLLLKKMRG